MAFSDSKFIKLLKSGGLGWPKAIRSNGKWINPFVCIDGQLMIGACQLIDEDLHIFIQGPEGWNIVNSHDQTKTELTTDSHIQRCRSMVEHIFGLVRSRTELHRMLDETTKTDVEVTFKFVDYGMVNSELYTEILLS